MWSDPREESRRIINHELYRHDLVHLHSLPLPKIGRASLPHGNVSECGFRGCCNRLYHYHAILASASEPKDEEERPFNQVVVCILRRVSGQRRREVMYVANLKQNEQESSSIGICSLSRQLWPILSAVHRVFHHCNINSQSVGAYKAQTSIVNFAKRLRQTHCSGDRVVS